MGALLKDARDVSAALTDLQIKGNKGTAWVGRAGRDITNLSNKLGLSKKEIIDYASAYTTMTGDVDGAMRALPVMGRVAVATGTKMADLAGVVEQLSGKLGIKNASEIYRSFNILSAQEKVGKVPLAALSQDFSKLTGQAQIFGRAGRGTAAVAAFGGLAQVSARGKGLGSLGEAMTAAERFVERIGRTPEKIERELGIKLRTSAGDFKPLQEVFTAIAEGVRRNPSVIAKKGVQLFGQRGVTTARELGSATDLAKIFAAGQGGKDVIAVDFEKRRKSQAFKFSASMERIKNTLQRIAIPLFNKLADIMPTIGKIVEFLVDKTELLLALWLGAKGLKFFKLLMAPVSGAQGLPGVGVGAAGVGGAAAFGQPIMGTNGRIAGYTFGRTAAIAPPRPSFGARLGQGAGRGAISALPFIPFAIAMGKSIGAQLAGGKTPDALRKEIKIGRENEAEQRAKRLFKGFATRVTGAGVDREPFSVVGDLPGGGFLESLASVVTGDAPATTMAGKLLPFGTRLTKVQGPTLGQKFRQRLLGTGAGATAERDIGAVLGEVGKSRDLTESQARALQTRIRSTLGAARAGAAAELKRSSRTQEGAETFGRISPEFAARQAIPGVQALEKLDSTIDKLIAAIVSNTNKKVVGVIDPNTTPAGRLALRGTTPEPSR